MSAIIFAVADPEDDELSDEIRERLERLKVSPWLTDVQVEDGQLRYSIDDKTPDASVDLWKFFL